MENKSITGEGSELPALPCPFCGNDPRIGEHRSTDETGESYGYSYIECSHKPSNLFVGVHADSPEDCLRLWNSRAALSSTQQESAEDAWKRGYEQALYRARNAVFAAGRDAMNVRSEVVILNAEPYTAPPTDTKGER